MKKLLYFLCALGMTVVSGCQEEEIALYNQEMAITFSTSTTLNYEFTDEDYVNGVTVREQTFYVQLQGGLLDENRTFCLTTEPREGYDAQPQLEFANPYTYNNLEGVTQKYTLTAHRPEKPSTTQGCLLTFDVNNAAHLFIKGRVDLNTNNVTVRYNIEPSNWQTLAWGVYSDAKYMFMMDVLEKTYSNILESELPLVVAAYEDYKAQGGQPITDDDGNEITFPTL